MSPLPSNIGTYEVIRLLGKGGMAVVYLGRDPAIDRLVAIKLLRESLDSVELRERFAREAKSAGRLRHPNIVTVFQVGVHESAPFIVMEYIPGESLAEIITRQPPLALTWKLRVVEDLCRGLAYAHKSDVVHRDMKPANIQIDSDGGVKILDFGIARLGEQKTGEQALTRLGMMMGTPNYMAPEQINPGTADHRSDVFAVGLVVYELLTYHRAFRGDDYALLHSILHHEPEPIERYCPDIDPEVVRIVKKAIAKDPGARYQDLVEMRDDVRRVRTRLHALSPDTSDEGSIAQASQPSVDATRLVNRAADVNRFLSEARDAYAAAQFDRAIRRCDRALEIDSTHAEAIDLRMRASEQITLAGARDLLAAGQEAYATGDLDGALAHIRSAEELTIANDEGTTVHAQLSALSRAVTAAVERRRAVQERIESARDLLRRGALQNAAQLIEEALSVAPGNRDAVALRNDVRAAIDEERARQRAAEDAVAEARLRAERGEFASAMAFLQEHRPQHPLVTAALVDIGALRAEAEERAADERRRRDHCAAAKSAFAAARETAVRGDLAGALKRLQTIAFGDPALSSAELDRLKIDVDTFAARCDAGVHLETARAALAATDLAAAAAALERARQRDGYHPDIAAVAADLERDTTVRDRLDRARSELQRGDIDDAERTLGEALALAPAHRDALQLRHDVRTAIAERERALRAAADEVIAIARDEAARGEYTKAMTRLKDHQPAQMTVSAVLAEIAEQQAAAARRAADQRRRQEHATRAQAAVRAAHAAADQGDPVSALTLLQGIQFQGAEIASPALAALEADAEVLTARCEAAQQLEIARGELAEGNRAAAAAAIERARLRDDSVPGLDEISSALSTETIVLKRPPSGDVGAPEVTLYLPRPGTPAHGTAGPVADEAFPAARPAFDADAEPTIVRPSAPPAAPPTPAPPSPKPLQVRAVPAPARAGDTPPAARRTPFVWIGAAVAALFLAGVWWMASGPGEAPTQVAVNPTSIAVEAPPAAAPDPGVDPAPQPQPPPGATPTPAPTPRRENPTPPQAQRPNPAEALPGRGRGVGRAAAPEPTTIAPPVPVSVPLPQAPSAAPQTASPTPSTAPPVADPPPAPRPPPPAIAESTPERPPALDPTRDQSAIVQALEQYIAGYESLNLAALRRAWPSAPASLAQSFADARSFEVTLQDRQITVRGDTATVSATRRLRQQPKAGKMLDATARVTLALRRSGGGWIIESVR